MPSAFLDHASPPEPGELANVLGRSAALWAGLCGALAAEHAPLKQSWSWSGKARGWLLKLQHKQRTLVYLVPCAGFAVASFALRESACAAALELELPAPVLRALREAPRFAEGRGVKLELRAKKDLAAVLALARLQRAS